ncbi:sigma-70 family RNA polymerase sigma factor [Stieleria sp. TO1_6]|uniref:RNA polymerase sigma factor n=1 Tax=Stieleria tagensis TaxID=2956795 RepID=UPI00209B3A93|nr:sigma-70 family RNA polymerase sigma factor [Stieleria tagensis]MCO8122913.1 sigma-70 family RNA polymerase sigma factor [Stieleria tagensis]
MDDVSVGGQSPSSTGSKTVSVPQSNDRSDVSSPVGNEPGEDRLDDCDEGAAELDATELVVRHQSGVWRYLRMLGCDDATADDLTQETFLRVLRRNDFVQHNDSATAGYLRRTAYNLLVSRHRKLGRVQTIAEPELLDETWDRWAGKDLTGNAAVEALQHCFEKLTERAQLALRMRFDSSASRVEIGEALGITDHGARNLMQRAKQQLRSCVEEKLQLVNES